MATTLTVTTAADSGAGSLRAAIARAQAGDTIRFSSALSNQTIRLSSGQLAVNKNLTIDGQDAPGLTLSGENTHRVMQVEGTGTTVTVQNVAIANGFTTERGGGIGTDMDTQITVRNVRFENNVAHLGGGAVYSGYRTQATVIDSTFLNNDGSIGKNEHGGGAILIWSESVLTVRGSTFRGNKGHNGGAINNLISQLTVENSRFFNNDSTSGADGTGTSGYGGAIYTDGASDPGNSDSGTILIRNSHFEGNRGAGQGGALFLFAYPPDRVIVEGSTIINNTVIKDAAGAALGGGLRHGNSELILRNSTFAGNLALSQGGGLWIGETSPTTITNTTFSANRADDGAGGGLGGAVMVTTNNSATTITHSTFAYNEAGFMGGAFYAGDQSITLTNSLVAHNTAGNPWSLKLQTNRQFTDGGGNLQFPAPQTTAADDVTITAGVRIVDPQLLPLGDYGGLTFVHALPETSPAVNQGVDLDGLTLDQRGITRDDRPDVGAYEWSSDAPTDPIDDPSNTPTPEADTLEGTMGDDVIRALGGDDAVLGGSGNDRLFGNGGNDRLVGGEGNDRAVGGTGRDRLFGNTGNDTLLGGGDNDHLLGAGGRDRLLGHGGNDKLVGGSDNDRLLGGTGRDRLDGKGSDDLLKGGGDRDFLDGGRGNDRLFGDAGNDVIITGAGSDRIFVRQGQGFDRVRDFSDNEDKIVLTGITFGQLTLQQRQDDVLIQLEGSNLLLLENTTRQQITAADFI